MPVFRNIKFNNSGFTLIEIIITISIMATLFGIATLNFQNMRKKNNIEAQVRDLFTVLMEARNNAFMQKAEYGVIIKEKSYQIKSYSSETDTTGVNVKSGSYSFKLTERGTDLPTAGIIARFDSSGFLSSTAGTIGALGTTLNADINDTTTSLNCLVIHSARVNMGKWNATTSECDFK